MRLRFLTVSWVFGVLSVSAPGAWDGRIYDAANRKFIEPSALHEALSGMENIALGEKHYTAAIQKAQADIITGVVRTAKREGRFTVGWEFLYRKDREIILKAFDLVLTGKLSPEEFAKASQGGNAEAVTYAPILEAVRAHQGELVGTNLTREEKRPAVKGGLEAMDPKLVPPDFKLGSAAYFERFQKAMGGGSHGAIKNYFVAQCLTDAWLAESLVKTSAHDLRFLVAGSFHVDYRDGAVAELYARGRKAFTRSVRFVDATEHSAAELQGLLSHPKYGDLADYIIYVGEPAGSAR